MPRRERVAQAIKREVSIVIHDELKDSRLGFITIVRVELSADLRQVRVFYSVLGEEKERKKSKEALNSAVGYIRKLVSEKINLKFAPEFIFREDRGSEYSVRIQEILDQINTRRQSELRRCAQSGKENDEPKKSNKNNKKVE